VRPLTFAKGRRGLNRFRGNTGVLARWPPSLPAHGPTLSQDTGVRVSRGNSRFVLCQDLERRFVQWLSCLLSHPVPDLTAVERFLFEHALQPLLAENAAQRAREIEMVAKHVEISLNALIDRRSAREAAPAPRGSDGVRHWMAGVVEERASPCSFVFAWVPCLSRRSPRCLRLRKMPHFAQAMNCNLRCRKR
jgi:hypothetical protein